MKCPICKAPSIGRAMHEQHMALCHYMQEEDDMFSVVANGIFLNEWGVMTASD
jgi:hypothetical protein